MRSVAHNYDDVTARVSARYERGASRVARKK